MFRRLLAAALVLGLAAPAFAADKVDFKKLKGSWLREVEGTKLTMKFKDEKTLRATISRGGEEGIVVDAEYAIDKDGVLSGVITKVEAKGTEGAPNKGDKFSFKIEIGKETMIVSEFKGVEGNEPKQLVEGEYKKQTD